MDEALGASVWLITEGWWANESSVLLKSYVDRLAHAIDASDSRRPGAKYERERHVVATNVAA